MVTAKGLKKNYGKFMALKGVDFSLSEGEVLGYIGPNGAGKSTSIKILLGLIRKAEGEAKVFGLDVWKDAVEIHKRVAYVPGDVNLWPNLTGGEVIDLFLSLKDKNDKAKREQFIERFELDPSKKCRTYSKGNRQKVALVAAFASNSDLFIFDEPTSGLDPLMGQTFIECVGDLKKEGKSVFLSSHILSEVEKLCDKVSIIKEGLIIKELKRNDIKNATELENLFLKQYAE